MNKTGYLDKIQINPQCRQFEQKPLVTDHFHNQNFTALNKCTSGLKSKPYVPNHVFINNMEPSLDVLNTNNMCKKNFTCGNTPTYKYLNKIEDLSPYFVKTDNGTYQSIIADSRLIDERHSYNMVLNERPAQFVYDKFNDNVSGNPSLKNYGKNYTSYSDVSGGQIRYYLDKDLSEPFFNPVYGMKSRSIGMEYKNPMDTLVPSYTKEYSTELIDNSLSFINDTTKFRDDIMSRQQRIHNSQKYELVYN